MQPTLLARGVNVHFGAHRAVADVSLEVHPGEIVGLIGPNGAGKTTTFNALTGFQGCTGDVVLDGTDVSRRQPHQRARLGMNRTFQRLEVFGSMSVLDNVRTAVEQHRRRRAGRGTGAIGAALELLETVGIEHLASTRADSLSTGQGRLLEIARVLASEPKVLLLDEPASGLDDKESERLAALLERVAAAGTSILLVEHDIDLVMRLCTRIYVLDFGRLLFEGTPEEVRSNPTVLAAYLGEMEV